jgi:glycosyltransferase involved in cell wall biosynthesis
MNQNYIECLCCRRDNNWLASWKLWALTFVRRFFCGRATANVAPTEWLGGILHLPRAIAIPHGLASKASTNPSRGESQPPEIVFQGRLVSTKGVRVLLEAARLLRQTQQSFRLVVIGDGPERTELEELAQGLQLSSPVHFVGRLSGEELEAALAKADIVVVPSLGGEVFGLVVAENMLRSLPIVVSDLGAFVEVLGDAGLTFRTGDASDLARQLNRLLEDSLLRRELGARARERVLQHFSLSHMINAHADVYRQISGNR